MPVEVILGNFLNLSTQQKQAFLTLPLGVILGSDLEVKDSHHLSITRSLPTEALLTSERSLHEIIWNLRRTKEKKGLISLMTSLRKIILMDGIKELKEMVGGRFLTKSLLLKTESKSRQTKNRKSFTLTLCYVKSKQRSKSEIGR